MLVWITFLLLSFGSVLCTCTFMYIHNGFFMYMDFSGMDYADVRPEFLFPAGSMVGDSTCVRVTVIDDSLIESTEQFTVSLDNAEAITVAKNESEVTITIEDNDGMNC